ncbi:hypothetical protein ACHAW6_009308, partial [Cyclotella cf. meneghiniana]
MILRLGINCPARGRAVLTNQHGEYYGHLPTQPMHQIDGCREQALKYQLNKCTLTLTSTHFIKSLHQSSDKDTCECPVQGCSNIDKEELHIHIAIPLTRCKDISKNRAIFVANCCEATKE